MTEATKIMATSKKLLSYLDRKGVYHIDCTYKLIKNGFPVFGVTDLHGRFHPLSFISFVAYSSTNGTELNINLGQACTFGCDCSQYLKFCICPHLIACARFYGPRALDSMWYDAYYDEDGDFVTKTKRGRTANAKNYMNFKITFIW